MINLENKEVLLTGATGGIGEEIAKSFINQGAFVVLSGTNNDKLEKLSQKLGDNTKFIACNLSNSDEVDNLFAKAEELVDSPVSLDQFWFAQNLPDWGHRLGVLCSTLNGCLRICLVYDMKFTSEKYVSSFLSLFLDRLLLESS